MPTITSAGVGSGLDVTGLVEQLVAAEGEPVRKRLDRKEAELQAGLSAMGMFKGAVSEFQASLRGLADSETFSAISARTDQEDSIAVSASQDAREGDYEIEILQMAEAQRLSTDAFDSDKKFFGTGRLTLQLGRYDATTNSFVSNPDVIPVNIDINESNSSLRGIADAINKSGAQVRATVLNDGEGYRLVLSALQEGSANNLRITVRDDDGNATDLRGLSNLAYDAAQSRGTGNNLQETVAAQDARVRIDGIVITRPTNQFEQVIPGVDFSLKSAAAGDIASLKVALDTEKMLGNIQGFVEKYNEMMTTVNELTAYNPETGVAGPLSGDTAVRGVVTLMRREIGRSFQDINQRFVSLASIGINTQRDGTLSINAEQLRRAIETDRQEVANLFARTGSADDALVEFVAAGQNTSEGRYALDVTQLASQGILIGTALAAQNLQLQDETNAFTIKVNGISSNPVSLQTGRYNNPAQLAAELQAAINADTNLRTNDVRVKVEAQGNQLLMRSESYGSNSSLAITAITPSLAALTGFNIGNGQNGQDVAGRLNGQAAMGIGQKLQGLGGARGLEVRVTGGETGERGQVIYVRGIAARLDGMLSTILDTDGILSARTDGFNERIETINRDREKLARRLAQSEERYMQQFTSMDNLVGKLRSTGEYLNRQLAALPGAKQSGNKA